MLKLMGSRLPCIVVLFASIAAAADAPPGWETYRSVQFGWALSHPVEIELVSYFGGQSGELRDRATGRLLAQLEVWPPDECPREPPHTTAESVGRERATVVTQTDGCDGSSSCGAPMTVRRFASEDGVPLYELRLTCRGERLEGGHRIRDRQGHKGPTFFADVSQPWRRRVLTVDPVGVDPRMSLRAKADDVVAVRRILATLTTFPVPDPKTVCIEDLSAGSTTGLTPTPSAR
jgi:hypothetical protein